MQRKINQSIKKMQIRQMQRQNLLSLNFTYTKCTKSKRYEDLFQNYSKLNYIYPVFNFSIETRNKYKILEISNSNLVKQELDQNLVK